MSYSIKGNISVAICPFCDQRLSTTIINQLLIASSETPQTRVLLWKFSCSNKECFAFTKQFEAILADFDAIDTEQESWQFVPASTPMANSKKLWRLKSLVDKTNNMIIMTLGVEMQYEFLATRLAFERKGVKRIVEEHQKMAMSKREEIAPIAYVWCVFESKLYYVFFGHPFKITGKNFQQHRTQGKLPFLTDEVIYKEKFCLLSDSDLARMNEIAGVENNVELRLKGFALADS